MSCCGGGRFRIASSPMPRAGGGAVSHDVRATHVVFRSESEAPLVVIGGVTKTKYRFAGVDDEIAVDIRDRKSVRSVPRLREMRVV
ncbi:MAG: hypothetical protein M3Q69_21245 [Acidobacteriota bacterium]|nr:hypothetical protein [Acidobacteriota bacterium]